MTQSEEKEFLLRGKSIALSAKIEAIIAGIILISNIRNPIDELVQLRGVMMNEKIKKARCLLKKFHPEIYQIANPILKGYKKISAFRNQMAHCVFEWNDPTYATFCVLDIVKDQDGDYFDQVKITMDQAFEQLALFEKLVEDLGTVNELVMKSGGYATLFTLLGQANPPKN